MSDFIKGADRFKAQLSKLPQAVADAAREAMEEGADEIVEAMKRLVPVHTGKLRDSIGWTYGDPPKGSSGILALGGGRGKRRKPEEKVSITIYAGNDEAFYARWVEFGTKPHAQGGEFKGTESPGTHAKPFFFPTWRSMKRRLNARITRKVNAAIKAIK